MDPKEASSLIGPDREVLVGVFHFCAALQVQVEDRGLEPVTALIKEDQMKVFETVIHSEGSDASEGVLDHEKLGHVWRVRNDCVWADRYGCFVFEIYTTCARAAIAEARRRFLNGIQPVFPGIEIEDVFVVPDGADCNLFDLDVDAIR